jgi:6-phosphogluconolactonase
MSQAVRWHRFPDSATVAGEAVRRVLEAAQRAIAAKGAFRVVLAGGSTPEKAYRELAEANADWARWHIYLGDERCLPPDDPERNSVMIARAWLDHVPVPPRRVHWIAAESGPVTAADAYQDVVERALPFDLVLLGMGEDGHTASLFPGHEHDPRRRVVAVHGAPKPPPERVSLNYSVLVNSAAVLVMVTGRGKHPAFERWRNGDDLPVARLACANGVDVLVDDEAWNG